MKRFLWTKSALILLFDVECIQIFMWILRFIWDFIIVKVEDEVDVFASVKVSCINLF